MLVLLGSVASLLLRTGNMNITIRIRLRTHLCLMKSLASF
jgi:hypothetical protein